MSSSPHLVSLSNTLVQTETSQQLLIIIIIINYPQKMSPTEFDYPLTFYLSNIHKKSSVVGNMLPKKILNINSCSLFIFVSLFKNGK